ncbi:MAG: hypothetical protein JSV44_00565 [Candidatus Zixiibacteriota bacterium]|nr:MAG: hypothetical protein JSV44_00565 [candidate division Zixibacteria bacterium]
MKPSLRILQYSDKAQTAYGWSEYHPDDCDIQCDYAADSAEFVSDAREYPYDLVIVDGNDALSRILASIPVQSESPHETTDADSADDFGLAILSKFREPVRRPSRKLTLRRKHLNNEGYQQRDMKIVSFAAATLSHEINSPLMAITANAELLLDNYRALDSEIVSKIKIIASEASRIRKVTQKLAEINHLEFRDTITGKMINLDRSFADHPQKAAAGREEAGNKSLDKCQDRNIFVEHS